jgi:hypothetical protein
VLTKNSIIEEGQENPGKPTTELYLLANKEDEERQNSEKNVRLTRVMLIEVNRKN